MIRNYQFNYSIIIILCTVRTVLGKLIQNATVKWVTTRFNRPNFARSTLQYMINKEELIRTAPGAKTKIKNVLIEKRTGKYPDMDHGLATWVREMRQSGIPVECWMLPIEGKRILDELLPNINNDFKFNSRWRKSWMKRNNFSIRVVTSTNKAKKNIKAVISTIAEWHVRNRVHQGQVMNDQIWGRAHPTGVFNHDQVPIALATERSRTIDDTGKDVIWDVTQDDADSKRFATLNLTIPMEVLADQSNVPKAHIIFKASQFCRGEDWVGKEDKDGEPMERDLWHPDCIVSFQENAWADTAGNLYNLEKQSSHLKKALEEIKIINPQQFEDNLTSHRVDEVLAFWKDNMPTSDRNSYPANLTWCLQAVDCHNGIIYKTDVYRGIREESLKRIRACTGDELPKKFTAREKRIMLTHIVVATHKRLAIENHFFRSFISTGTWLPLDGSRDHEVALQGVDGYVHKEQVTPEKLEACKVKLVDELIVKQAAQDAKTKAAAEVKAACENHQAVLNADWHQLNNNAQLYNRPLKKSSKNSCGTPYLWWRCI